MIIDTHGHYDDEQFDVDREMLLTNLKERGLKAIVTVGASMQTSENALALAHQYPGSLCGCRCPSGRGRRVER